MKVLTLLVLVAAGLLALVALQADDPTYVAPTVDEMPTVVPHQVTGDVPEGFLLRSFDVEGMCCDGCSGKLYARLEKVEGVREAAVDPVLGRAEVVVAADTDPARLTGALTFDKYTARSAN